MSLHSTIIESTWYRQKDSKVEGSFLPPGEEEEEEEDDDDDDEEDNDYDDDEWRRIQIVQRQTIKKKLENKIKDKGN